MSPKVDEYLVKAKTWQKEIAKLRQILLDCHLTEELKWGKPCYTFQEGNVVIILPLKQCCALLLAKGALLNDPHGILIQPTENTQAARQIRFTNVRDIGKMESILQSYIHQAVEVEKAGLEVNYKKTSEFIIPQELQDRLDEDPAFRAAFNALTPGRQRGYILHFSAPKQSKTRASRIANCMQKILEGKGFNER